MMNTDIIITFSLRVLGTMAALFLITVSCAMIYDMWTR
jgi:hypothetical protein